MPTDAQRAIAALLESAIGAGACSGAQAAWWWRDALHEVAVGETRPRGGRPVEGRTLFDLASLTKAFSGSAALRLVDRGALGLGDNLAAYLPELAHRGSGRATLADLLAHEAGFTDWLPLHERVDTALHGTAAGYSAVVELALAAPCIDPPPSAAVYSDLGFVALAALLERATGRSLAEVIRLEVTEPLRLLSVAFRKVGRSPDEEIAGIAATEECPWRGRLLWGEVHDDNCSAMGGCSAHAGLFGTAEDVARLGRAWLEALGGSSAWLSPELARRAIERRRGGRALAWDTVSETGSSAGARLGRRSFGHLGFTGCSLWVDPEMGLSASLLTNRVCFGRDNLKIRELRPRFHDALVDVLAARR